MDPPLNTEAWDRLEAQLKDANSRRDKDPRGACRSALEAVLFFFHLQKPEWAGDGIHRPLLDLLTALIDRDKGRLSPLLAPIRFANKHREPTLREMMQGVASFAVELLVAIHPKRNVSASSQQVVAVWNKCTGEHLDFETVWSWYYRRDKLTRKDDFASDALTNFRALWDAENLDRPSAGMVKNVLVRNRLTANLNDHLPKVTVRNSRSFGEDP